MGTQEPCQATEVKISLDTDRNPHVERSAAVQPDGTYELQVSLTELPHERVDWKVSALNPASKPVELLRC